MALLLSVIGVKKGSEHRLPNHLEVSRKKKPGVGYTGGQAGAASMEAATDVHEQEKLV